ncbi:T9SS type A sorting domain-containing protein [Winogradskyella schleiferi]|uniref:T9SS type A sorting domain-containing protein n=1 Tax=Winogradskyella schleiferi TaxID=2686078 RepID=UPI0015BC8643|nr:T9SS type A sorting domain-containing protein [Winogradskyella schleiferi]
MIFFTKPTNAFIKVIFVFLFFFSNLSIQAQLPAFPSAKGAGAYTTGGRGGIVVHVTNLNASGPGSLKAALTMTVPRTIVFDVSGIISIDKLLYIGPESGDFTLAGQTAPEGGITIAGGRVYFAGVTNYIMRHIRFKGGFEADWVPNTGDNLGSASFSAVSDIYESIIDHCSFGFAKTMPNWVKQGSQVGLVDKTTIHRCFFSETVKGALIGQDVDNTPYYLSGDMTFSKNVFYNVRYRTPNITGNHGPGNSFDVINNLTWQAQGRITRSSGDTNINQLNNATYQGSLPLGDKNLNLYSEGWNPKIYTSGNIINAPNIHSTLSNTLDEMNADNTLTWKYFVGSNYGVQLPESFFMSTPYPIRGISQPILDASELRLTLPNDVGCNARLNADGSVSPNLDSYDAEYLQNILNNVMVTPIDNYSLNPIPSVTRPDNFYASNPHIPEIWFNANVPSGQNHNDIAPSGYTWLEEYLNQVDSPTNSIGVESVEVTPATEDLEITDTLQLATTFLPSNATNLEGTWTSSDETIATVDANGLVSPVSLGIVEITFTSNFNDSINDTSEITVFAGALEASAGIDQQICLGESTTLEASGGTNYVWSTGETTATIDVTPEATTTYSVNVADDYGQSEEVSVTITVNELPVAVAGEDQSICQGETTTLTASGGTSFLWNTGEITATIEVSPIEETVYSVEVSDENCSSTDEVTIFVNEAPELTITEDVVIVEGESTTLTASGSDNYEWNTGETTDSVTVNPTITTTYTVSTTGVGDCPSNAEVTVTVIPEVVANAGEDITICNGESVTLTASGGSTYAWDTGDVGSELIINPSETTTFTVTVEDDYGYTDTDEVTIFVNEAPELIVTEDLVIVEGESTTLNVTGSDNYAWSTGETTDSITVNPTVTETYTVTTTGVNGCSNNAEVTVTVIPEVVASAGDDVTICNGESVTLLATGGSAYTWNTGDVSSEIVVIPTETTTYSVIAEDNYGYTATDDVTIFVNEAPEMTVSDAVFVMIGNSAILTASGASTYSWNTGETSDEITVTPDVTTTYTVIGEGENGCQSTAEVIVTVVEQLNANAGEDVSICLGESITLNASGGITYTWNTGETGATPTLTPTETTTYTVTVEDGFGNSDSDDVTVTVNSVPTAQAGENQTICQGEAVTLTATAEGGDSYLWSTGETTASIVVNPNEDTVYTVEVSNGFCSHNDDVSVFVLPTPEIILSEDIVLVTGNTTTLEASGADTYLWSTGETTTSILVNPTETTTYTITGFLSNGCESTAQVIVTVVPQVVADAGEDVTICSGESVTLDANGGGNYSWNTGETSESIILTPTISTTYTVTVSDNYGNSDSDSVTVTVNELPNINLSDNITIFEGESTTLNVTGAATYLWNTSETTESIVVNPLETTTYSVTGYSVNDCQITDEVTVTVIPEVIANAGEDFTICEGESVTLNAIGGGGTNYSWNTGETSASISVSPTVTSTYTVTISDDFGNSDTDSVTVTVNELPNISLSDDITIFEGESTTLNVTGAVTYLWNTGETTESIVIAPLETTTYSVTGYSVNDCQITDEVTVTVIPEVIANAGEDFTICEGESVTLNATGGGGTNYSWNTGETSASISVSPTVTTAYTVTISDDFGNSDTDSVSVTVNELPSITLSNDISIIEGQSTTLTANGAVSYLWDTGETSNSITVSPIETTTYNVVGFSTSGCETIEEVTVTVIPEVIANAGNDVSICFGDSVTLNASGGGGTNYLWNTGQTSPSITIFLTETTTFTVTVSDDFGNSDSDSVTVIVNSLIEFDVSENVTIYEGESANLTATGAATYLWNTGETTETIIVNPTETTTYNVTGSSSGNCEITEEVTVTVIPEVNANAGNDVVICAGESVNLNASGGTNYSWNTGETSASITMSPTVTTTYSVTVSDDFGNSDSDSVTVTVNDLPEIDVSENITIFEGESATLNVNGAETYLWSTGETSDVINVSPTVTTTYTVLGLTNSCTSEEAQVTVTVTPLFVASAGTDEYVCDNQTNSVVLTASEGDSYIWSTGETTQSIEVNPLSTTSYSVTVTIGEQEASDNVVVHVDPSPNVEIANGDSIEILNGDFITLSASGANSYEWNNGATQPNIAVSPSITTTYEVRGYIGDCYDDKQVTVNVIQPVIAEAGEDQIICLDEVATLTANGGEEYLWSTGETTQTIEVSPEETTDYVVTVFNALDFAEDTVRVEVDTECNEQISSPTGIPKDFKFKLYPNPASDIVNIKYSGVLVVSDVYIYNVTGKLVQRTKVLNENISTSATKQIDISSLQSGVYFVKLIGEEKDITEKLLVK